MHLLYLAWRELVFHRARSITLLLALTLIFFLPLATARFVAWLERDLAARAEATPLMLGAKGSQLDLALHALYFQGTPPETLTHHHATDAASRHTGRTIPVFAAYTASGFPVVGLDDAYFAWRDLRKAHGTWWEEAGDCLLGHDVARALGLQPGDRLHSDPEELLNIAGSHPLNMRVVGILAPGGTPDDRAIFVSLKTAWIIAGIGHAHEPVADEASLSPDQRAALFTYNEVTPENRHRWHFHLPLPQRPLSAVLLEPATGQEAALLRARYDRGPVQILRSTEALQRLLSIVHQTRRLLHAVVALVTLAVGALLLLVLLLTLRMRRAEFETLHHIGCARGTTALLFAAGCGMLLIGAALLAVLGTEAFMLAAPDLARQLPGWG